MTAADIAHFWWSHALNRDTSPGRAARAKLRRASTHNQLLREPATLLLVSRLKYQSADRVAILAGILAHVTTDTRRTLPRLLGPPRPPDTGPTRLSEARLRRLLEYRGDDLLGPMRRVIGMADGAANVRHLTRAVLYWGPGVHRDWNLIYHDVMAPARHAGEDAEESHLTDQEDA